MNLSDVQVFSNEICGCQIHSSIVEQLILEIKISIYPDISANVDHAKSQDGSQEMELAKGENDACKSYSDIAVPMQFHTRQFV
jgi:hypothetical protein